jgi:hypothetical protein
VWVDSARALLERLDAIGVGFRVPGDASERLSGVIEKWSAAADASITTGTPFCWTGSETALTVRMLATYWLNLAELRPGDLDAVGVDWPTDAVRPFHRALAAGVADALSQDETTRDFAVRLRAALVG